MEYKFEGYVKSPLLIVLKYVNESLLTSGSMSKYVVPTIYLHGYYTPS